MEEEDGPVNRLCYLSSEYHFMSNSWRVKTEGDYISPPSHIMDTPLLGYEYVMLQRLLTLTFAQFGLMFLTFWWELARWLDGWMLALLYDGDTHSSWNLAGIQNTQDDLIMQFVMGTMFIVLPAFWMGALGWAGIQLGGVIERAAVTGTNDAKTSGGKLGESLSQKISK
ncbi:hypothetical protein FHD02_20100 [Citrobacter sp. EC_71]|nr:hypothetical protein [Citrobacter sp. EC_71]